MPARRKIPPKPQSSDALAAHIQRTAVSLNDLAESVVRVGEGRGFIVAGPRANYVITAAHVLPHPPAFPGEEEETYLRFIGPRDAEPVIAASCLFADPVPQS
jgi:hypothetical protein